MAITQDIISRTQRYEGDNNHQAVNHCYLDTSGYVTVAWGHKISPPPPAISVRLIHKTDLLAATDSEKLDEWKNIKAMPKGLIAARYDSACKLKMTQSDMDNLLTTDLANTERQLIKHFTNYTNFPSAAQAGLIDMAYNVGVKGLITSFPNFVAAVQNQNWTAAAKECHRAPPIAKQRNIEVMELFFQAATQAAPKPTPSPTSTPIGTTGSSGIKLGASDFSGWPDQFTSSQGIPASSTKQAVAVGGDNPLSGYLLDKSVESQSIVAIVALTSNVTAVALAAITAISCNNRES